MTAETIFSPPGSVVTVRKKDRRLSVRVAVRLPMKFITENNVEGSGRVVNMSTSGMHFLTPVDLPRGERVVCYVQYLGRLSGYVARLRGDNVAIAFDISPMKRDRLADQLTWIINKDRLGLDEERVSERVVGSGSLTVTCANGRKLDCSVIDMSMTGVAVSTKDERPFVGESVTCGIRKGKVARYVDGGFAVEFSI